MDYWRELAAEAGLPGLHLVATLDFHDCNWDAAAHGYDAVTVWTLGRVTKESTPSRFMARWKSRLQRGLPRPLHPLVEKISSGLDYVYDYGEVRGQLVCENQFNLPYHPMIVPNWDTTARYGERATIPHGSDPEKFRPHLRDALKQVENVPPEGRIVFLKSWNEWAEGNYLEPDRKFGRGYLEVAKQELESQVPISERS